MKKKICDFVYLALIVSLAPCCGCEKSRDCESKNDLQNDGFVTRLKPSELFSGELRKIEPHMDLISSGCINIDANKKKFMLKVLIEVWAKGKLEKTHFSHSTSVSEKCDLSFSLRKSCSDDHNKYFAIIGITDSRNNTKLPFNIEVPINAFQKNDWQVSKFLSEPADLKENEKVTIWNWGYIDEGNKNAPIGETIDEMAKRLKWAMILKIKVDTVEE